MYGCLACVYTFMFDASRGQKKALGPLELELQMVVGNQTWIL